MATRKPEKTLIKKLADLAAADTMIAKVIAAREVSAAAETLERLVVAEARESGLTWTQIGTAFNMTKQAAQQRFKA